MHGSPRWRASSPCSTGYVATCAPPQAGSGDPGDSLPAPYRALAGRLGSQQRAVLELLLDGQPNSRIAEQLGLSVGTVKNYVSMILGLFDVESRAQLIARLRG